MALVATFERYMWLVSCAVERYTLVTDGYYASSDIGNVQYIPVMNALGALYKARYEKR